MIWQPLVAIILNAVIEYTAGHKIVGFLDCIQEYAVNV